MIGSRNFPSEHLIFLVQLYIKCSAGNETLISYFQYRQPLLLASLYNHYSIAIKILERIKEDLSSKEDLFYQSKLEIIQSDLNYLISLQEPVCVSFEDLRTSSNILALLRDLVSIKLFR